MTQLKAVLLNLDSDELKRFDKFCQERGMSRSAVVRVLIRLIARNQ
jgi:metal-responsive CopG/Arc/MetJ family transcriptional regulator